MPKASAAPAKLRETGPSYFEVEDCADGCRVRKYTGPDKGAVVIPSRIGGKKVVKIGEEAFLRCESLTSVTIPYGVTEIGDEAFVGCNKLTIHAPVGSVAEQYAKQNRIPFRPL